MKRKMKVIFVACFIASLLFNVGPSKLQAEDVFITIGGGDFAGVYYPTGLAIASMINNKRHDYGIRATVEATPGSVFNLNAIMAGYLEFGLAQADKQYQAVNGLAEWAKKGPQKELRAVFSLHHESVTLVAAVDAGINTIADLKGKRVNLGNPGSGQHWNAIDALEAVGLDPKRDILPQKVKASEAPALLQDNRIDAFFCTVGHPSETIQTALSGLRKVRIVPISGPGIDKLIADNSYYRSATIPAGMYNNKEDITTFGVGATFVTSADVPDDVVYTVVKSVFENFDQFKKLHPAFANLKAEEMIKDGLSAPLHDGAMKYYKEKGWM